MACSFPMWRLSWSEHLLNNGWSRHRLADVYEKRVHNDGIILQRPEAEMIRSEYPDLGYKMQQVPCGKCIQCRLSYSRDWANRCMCELKTAKNAYFLTLTYDDSHLEFCPYADAETGQLLTRPVLVPRHLTLFFKRLRKYCCEIGLSGQRYFACGEYGEETERPHYHAIVYNLPDEVLAKSKSWPDSTPEAPLWTSPVLSELWPHGIVVYGDVNWNTCAYVARYVVKKQLGKSRADQIKMQQQFFPDSPWQHEFVHMSRRPGIGRDYFETHKDEIYQTDELFVPIKGEVQAVRPAKYYDKLYDVDHHLALRKLKKARSLQSEAALDSTLHNTDLTEVEYLELKDRIKEDQSRRLVRPSI